jgi:hypothetical protein
VPATIECRIFVFEITVSEFTELLLFLLSHKVMYTLSTTGTFISVYCLLHILAFVEKFCKGIKKYIMMFSIQHCRMIISFTKQSKHAA